MQVLKKLLRISLLVVLFGGAAYVGKELGVEARKLEDNRIISVVNNEESIIQDAIKKESPLRLRGQTFCSSSQIEYKGNRFTLTNRHCCQVITRRNGSKEERRRSFKRLNLKNLKIDVGGKNLRILKLDPIHDLCVLEPDLSKDTIKIADSYKQHEKVFIVGHPRGLPKTVREGRIMIKDYDAFYWLDSPERVGWLHLSVLGYGGNSGSPVFNMRGELVGVIFMGWRGIHTEMGAVPVEDVKDFLDSIVE